MAMQKEYRHLYMVLGEHTRLFPFEGVFMHAAEGRPFTPNMFQSKRTQDVRDWMKRCNALPENAESEPVDSVSSEFDFMRQLYTNMAGALHLDDHTAAASWRREVAGFRAEHVDMWIPAFMKHTLTVTRSPVYSGFARLAILALAYTSADQEE